MNLRDEIEDILNLDSDISLVAAIDNKGKIIKQSRRHNSKKNYLDNYSFEVALIKDMHDLYDEHFGKMQFSYVERERSVQLFFYLDNGLVFIECKKGLSSSSIITIAQQIRSIISKKFH